MNLQKNQCLDVEIIDMTHEGIGVAKVDGMTVFVKGALKTEKVHVKITKVKPSYCYARVLNIYKLSEERTTPPCPIYNQCGGCSLQHLTYEAQLINKQSYVKNSLQRLGKLGEIEVSRTIGMENPWNYRNKAQVPIGLENGRVVTGFYKQRSHQVVACEECAIQADANNIALTIIRDLCNQYNIPVYDEKRHKGALRHILIRTAKETGELMVVLVTTKLAFKGKEQLIKAIAEQVPDVVSIVQNLNPDKTNVILGNSSTVLWGKGTISEKIAEYEYAISAHSFFQVNPEMTEILYKKILSYANLAKTDIVFDVYCGIGTIAIFLAQAAGHVYGVEVVNEAIIDANYNAEVNNIANVSFATGDAGAVLEKWLADAIKPNVIVLDPPRKGCDKVVLEQVIKSKAEKVIYVSCHPGTLARDLVELTSNGYEIEVVQPLDMFPQTSHVETVVLLSHKKTDSHIHVKVEYGEAEEKIPLDAISAS